jgi:hypothetical protein
VAGFASARIVTPTPVATSPTSEAGADGAGVSLPSPLSAGAESDGPPESGSSPPPRERVDGRRPLETRGERQGRRSSRHTGELLAQGEVGDDDLGGTDHARGVGGVGRDDGGTAALDDLVLAVDDEGDPSGDDVPDLLLLVLVLVEVGGPVRDRPAGERHARRVKEPSVPACQR